SEQNLRRTGIIAVCGLILSALVFGPRVSASSDQERPRSTQTATPTPTPTSPATVPARPAPTATPQTQRPTDRIAPTLGEPPPPPKLKPTPTPTPPPVIEEGDILRINAELVQLHVRVIDRNNKPINN